LALRRLYRTRFRLEARYRFGFIARTPRAIEWAMRRDLRIGVVMRPDHPLAKAPGMTIAACLDYPVAVAKPEGSIREVIEPFLQPSALLRPPVVEVDSIRMLVDLAQIGHYVVVMTPIGAKNETQSGNLAFRPLEDPGLPTYRFAFMVRSADHWHFAPTVFYENAKQHFEAINLPGAV
jgi:DNA-binding transcriptional LysR family regulator